MNELFECIQLWFEVVVMLLMTVLIIFLIIPASIMLGCGLWTGAVQALEQVVH